MTVSPADMEVTRTCTDCQAVEQRWRSYGTASSIPANFVQKLAVEVEARLELTVMFLPYLN